MDGKRGSAEALPLSVIYPTVRIVIAQMTRLALSSAKQGFMCKMTKEVPHLPNMISRRNMVANREIPATKRNEAKFSEA